MEKSQKHLVPIDTTALHLMEKRLEEKLDRIIDMIPKKAEGIQLEWLTNKQFKEAVSIRAYETLVKIRDKMPDTLKREINGKHYIHREAVKKYFQGEFSS